ncbi:MAG TPA: CoA ester lyase [Steroidobacteraceae bacterium]|nr:CoA ester lyase [Steroidobacteraceae bacterium]
MSERSWLFVPGDSERKLERAASCGADALILDLEDSVAAARLPAARECVLAHLNAHPTRERQRLWVRVNALGSGRLLEDLVAVMPGVPDGILLPKVSSNAELNEVHHYLSALEHAAGRAEGSTGVAVIATETPEALFAMGGYRRAPARLRALTWGAEDLAAALGASPPGAGDASFTFELARALCVVAAAAAGVQAVDGVHTAHKDAEGLSRELARARRDGFTGKLAIHPDQVEPINAAFTPNESELAHARSVVAAFASNPDLGVASIEGRMIDRPHLLAAQRLLAAAERAGRRG